jgi:hypothetical protein
MPENMAIDGYLSRGDDPLRGFHAAIGEYLVARERAHVETGRDAGLDLKPIKKKFTKPDLIRLIKALLARVAYLREHRAELPRWMDWHRYVVELLHALYGARLPFAAADLEDVLRATLALALPVAEPLDCLIGHLDEHPLTPQLSAVLRTLHEKRNDLNATSQQQATLVFQRLHMLCWLDEWDELAPKKCWSEVIRGDWRAMTGERRERWRRFFYHLRGDTISKPSKRWLATAKERLAAVGIADFRERLRVWFQPFREPEPLPLSVGGSYALKCLIWYCSLAEDQACAEVALSLLDAPWRQKARAKLPLIALSVLLERMPAGAAWQPLVRLRAAVGDTGAAQVVRLLQKVERALGRAGASAPPAPFPFPERASPQSFAWMARWLRAASNRTVPACWSEVIRRDYQAMTPAQQERWQALFRGFWPGGGDVEPRPSWKEGSRAGLAAVGVDDFRERALAWLAVLSLPVPATLSREGGIILKNLAWCAALVETPALGDAMRRLPDAPWRDKSDAINALAAVIFALGRLSPEAALETMLRLHHRWGILTDERAERFLAGLAKKLGVKEADLILHAKR